MNETGKIRLGDHGLKEESLYKIFTIQISYKTEFFKVTNMLILSLYTISEL